MCNDLNDDKDFKSSTKCWIYENIYVDDEFKYRDSL